MANDNRLFAAIAILIALIPLLAFGEPSAVVDETVYHVLHHTSGLMQTECMGDVSIANPGISQLYTPAMYHSYPLRFYFFEGNISGPLLEPPIMIPYVDKQGSAGFFVYQCRAAESVLVTRYPYFFSLALSPNKIVYRTGETLNAEVILKNNSQKPMTGISVSKTYTSDITLTGVSTTFGSASRSGNSFSWSGFDLGAGEIAKITLNFSFPKTGTFRIIDNFALAYNGQSYYDIGSSYKMASSLRITINKAPECFGSSDTNSCANSDLNGYMVSAVIENETDLVNRVENLKVLRSPVANKDPNSAADITSNIRRLDPYTKRYSTLALPFDIYPSNRDNNAIIFYVEDFSTSPQIFWIDMESTVLIGKQESVSVNDYTFDYGFIVIQADANTGLPKDTGKDKGSNEIPISGGGGGGGGSDSSAYLETHETGPIIEYIDKSKPIIEKYVAPTIIKPDETAQITLSISNLGNIKMNDVEVVDFVQRNFVINYANYTSIREVLDGYELSWKIDELEPAKEVLIKYKLTPIDDVLPGAYQLGHASVRILGQEKARSKETMLSVAGKEREKISSGNYFIETAKEIREGTPKEYEVVITMKNTGSDTAPDFVLRDYCGSSVRAITPTPDRLPCSWNISNLSAGEERTYRYFLLKDEKTIEYPNLLGLEESKFKIGLSVFTKMELKSPQEKILDAIANIISLLATLAAIAFIIFLLAGKWYQKPGGFSHSRKGWKFVKDLFRI